MVIMSTTLNFLGGAPFQLLYDGVKLAMSNTSKFKTHLRSLKFTLDCLQPQIVEQIRLQNLQLEIPVHEIQELQSKIDEGIVLVNRLSSINNCNIGVWGSCCSCLIHSYADQLEELNESLRRLLEILRLQSIAQVNNIGILARTTRDRQDELGRRQQEILSNQRLIIDTLMKQHQMLERIERNGVEASTGREGPAPVQVVRLEEVFQELLDAVVQVKVKNSWFKRFLEDFKFTLDCLKPLVQEIAECNKVLHFPKEDVLEDFIVYLEKGVELVYKCSKISLWNRFRKYEYINSLFELDESLQRLFGILRLQIENDVNQALVYVNKLEREIEEIEGSCVLSKPFPLSQLSLPVTTNFSSPATTNFVNPSVASNSLSYKNATNTPGALFACPNTVYPNTGFSTHSLSNGNNMSQISDMIYSDSFRPFFTQFPFITQGTLATTGFVSPPTNSLVSTGFVAHTNNNTSQPQPNGSQQFSNGGSSQQYNNRNDDEYPRFLSNNQMNNNYRGNNNSRPRFNGGNYANKFVICQICDRSGHSAYTCRQRNTQQGEASSSTVVCQICKKSGHISKFCRYINSNQNQQKSNSAFLARGDSGNEVWIVDSGATNHMTSDIHQIQNVTSYNSCDSVQIGQGDMKSVV